MIKKKTYYSKEQLDAFKKNSISYVGEQECFCLGLLLSHNISFTLLKPSKFPTSDLHYSESVFFKISHLHLNDETIEFDKLIQHELDDAEVITKNSPNMTKVKLSKYQNKNKTNITNNFLIELIERLNYQCKIKSTRQTKCVVQMKRIQEISHKNYGSFSSQQISEIGNKICSELIELFKRNDKRKYEPLKIKKDYVSNILSSSVDMNNVIKDFIQEHRRKFLNN